MVYDFDVKSTLARIGSTGLIGNRYELLELVGEGTMGAVYRCRDRLGGAQLALKRLKSGDDSQRVRMALEEEAEVTPSGELRWVLRRQTELHLVR